MDALFCCVPRLPDVDNSRIYQNRRKRGRKYSSGSSGESSSSTLVESPSSNGADSWDLQSRPSKRKIPNHQIESTLKRFKNLISPLDVALTQNEHLNHAKFNMKHPCNGNACGGQARSFFCRPDLQNTSQMSNSIEYSDDSRDPGVVAIIEHDSFMKPICPVTVDSNGDSMHSTEGQCHQSKVPLCYNVVNEGSIKEPEIHCTTLFQSTQLDNNAMTTALHENEDESSNLPDPRIRHVSDKTSAEELFTSMIHQYQTQHTGFQGIDEGEGSYELVKQGSDMACFDPVKLEETSKPSHEENLDDALDVFSDIKVTASVETCSVSNRLKRHRRGGKIGEQNEQFVLGRRNDHQLDSEMISKYIRRRRRCRAQGSSNASVTSSYLGNQADFPDQFNQESQLLSRILEYSLMDYTMKSNDMDATKGNKVELKPETLSYILRCSTPHWLSKLGAVMVALFALGVGIGFGALLREIPFTPRHGNSVTFDPLDMRRNLHELNAMQRSLLSERTGGAARFPHDDLQAEEAYEIRPSLGPISLPTEVDKKPIDKESETQTVNDPASSNSLSCACKMGKSLALFETVQMQAGQLIESNEVNISSFLKGRLEVNTDTRQDDRKVKALERAVDVSMSQFAPGVHELINNNADVIQLDAAATERSLDDFVLREEEHHPASNTVRNDSRQRGSNDTEPIRRISQEKHNTKRPSFMVDHVKRWTKSSIQKRASTQTPEITRQGIQKVTNLVSEAPNISSFVKSQYNLSQERNSKPSDFVRTRQQFATVANGLLYEDPSYLHASNFAIARETDSTSNTNISFNICILRENNTMHFQPNVKLTSLPWKKNLDVIPQSSISHKKGNSTKVIESPTFRQSRTLIKGQVGTDLEKGNLNAYGTIQTVRSIHIRRNVSVDSFAPFTVSKKKDQFLNDYHDTVKVNTSTIILSKRSGAMGTNWRSDRSFMIENLRTNQTLTVSGALKPSSFWKLNSEPMSKDDIINQDILRRLEYAKAIGGLPEDISAIGAPINTSNTAWNKSRVYNGSNSTLMRSIMSAPKNQINKKSFFRGTNWIKQSTNTSLMKCILSSAPMNPINTTIHIVSSNRRSNMSGICTASHKQPAFGRGCSVQKRNIKNGSVLDPETDSVVGTVNSKEDVAQSPSKPSSRNSKKSAPFRKGKKNSSVRMDIILISVVYDIVIRVLRFCFWFALFFFGLSFWSTLQNYKDVIYN